MHLRALILLPHHEQMQENVIYFKVHIIFDNSIFSITSEKIMKFTMISAGISCHSIYYLSLLKGISN